MKRGVTMVNAKETRDKLIKELNAQFSSPNESESISFAPDEPIVTFPSPTFEKPKMFEPVSCVNVKKTETTNNKIVKGIGFAATNYENRNSQKVLSEIYNMKEFINSNPETMSTFIYDEKVMKKQLALIRKKDWHDILFEDVDWFMQIDIVSSIKKLFGGVKF